MDCLKLKQPGVAQSDRTLKTKKHEEISGQKGGPLTLGISAWYKDGSHTIRIPSLYKLSLRNCFSVVINCSEKERRCSISIYV